MGWFWADSPSASSPAATKLAPPPNHPTSGAPPPSCPMHQSPAARATPSACPYTPPDSTPSSTEPAPESSSSGTGSLNPLNFMFSSLPQTRHADQKTALPTDREVSSIPKADGTAWEYPSPQQMYNAMRRKGYDGTDEEAVPSMVSVHNFLNEGAWGEICEWEKRFGGGVLKALRGEEGEGISEGWPRLERFQGRSRDMTPKARMLGMLGRVWPEKFGGEPPFDRHDWYVLRQMPGEAEPRKVRYVIDYYSAPPEPSGQPVFYLDVRPAVDRPGAVMERVIRWGGDVWEKASGADVRRREMAEKFQKENGL